MLIAKSIVLFITAGLCEIRGGYLIWLWLRENKGSWFAIAGAIILILYGIVPTFQPAHFGRVYAAYGGILLFCPFSGDGKQTTSKRTALI